MPPIIALLSNRLQNYELKMKIIKVWSEAPKYDNFYIRIVTESELIRYRNTADAAEGRKMFANSGSNM